MIESPMHDAGAPQAELPADLAALLSGAVELARTAIVEFSGDGVVGEYLGSSFDDPSSATHRFLADMRGYQGWQWAVVIAAHPGSEHPTISEVVLVPGPTALLAPRWVPWQERIQPGDLSPGDLLATPANDPRLVPGYVASGDQELDELAGDIGLGRQQVLSEWGRIEAAQRWHEGDYGHASAMARSTRKVCRDCGFYLSLAGSLGTMFGVCANEMSADGHVVSGEYGCGAHSDTPQPATMGSPLYDPYDDGVIEVTDVVPVLVVDDVPAETAEPETAEPTEAEAAVEPLETADSAEAAQSAEPVEPEPAG